MGGVASGLDHRAGIGLGGGVSVRVGLVGAGPWAGMFHAPMLSADAGTTLEAVWSRRPEAAQALAAEHGATAAASYEDLLDRCEAVAFAVPPDIQAGMAVVAARAGKHLILEKPLAFTLEDAERLTAAVDEVGVQTVLMLRNRFTAVGRAFVEAAQGSTVRGGVAQHVTGAALPGSPFATPWRIERGALFDLGPHLLDLMDASMGRIEHVDASGDPRALDLDDHPPRGRRARLRLAVHHDSRRDRWLPLRGVHRRRSGGLRQRGVRQGHRCRRGDHPCAGEAVETGETPLVDVHRGLHLQRLIAGIDAQLS